ncbi:4-carboxymuconolactone decarboxylase [Klebsiella aerogenes]|nr:4-carboxymuconolactone decarboxylase [Klebsiella aerogenes]
MDDKQRYQDGMAVRRKVLGDAHVDRTLQHLTPLNDEFRTLLPAMPGARPGRVRGSITIPAA